MEIDELYEKLSLSENKDIEFKSAKGGFPGSFWETYSAMANTDGGVIILGIQEKKGHFEIQGIDRVPQLTKSFWDLINNRNTVNVNLFSEQDLQHLNVENKDLLIFNVPRAGRFQRPVFIGLNPQTGTYRRYHEGDYHCTQEEVGRMLADQSQIPADSRILEGFLESDLDSETIQQYRNRFSARNASHPWLSENIRNFLMKLGGWRKDRSTKQEGFTVAGILMFGNEDAIQNLSVELKFNLDYRERASELMSDRWLDRITIDGLWTPNLFQFYLKVYPKLTAGLKLPFAYREASDLFLDPIRVGQSPVHEAIQEGLVNALIHADYSGDGGIVVDRFPNRFELSNPGTLLVSLEQLRNGAISECRNPSLQKMFQMIGLGDRAGSGIDKIWKGWETQKWREPQILERQKPDRVVLELPMISLLPLDSVIRLKKQFGARLELLTQDQIFILVAADLEKQVTNERIQPFLKSSHAADISKLLHLLVRDGFLERFGYGRWATYRLMPGLAEKESLDGNSPRNEANSPRNGGNSPRNEANSPRNEANSPRNEEHLRKIAEPARAQQRMEPQKMKRIIEELCRENFLTSAEIARLLSRNLRRVRETFIKEMVQEGTLELRYPLQPNHPNQAYRTKNSLPVAEWMESRIGS